MASGEWYIAYKKGSKYIRYFSSSYKTTLDGKEEKRIHRS